MITKPFSSKPPRIIDRYTLSLHDALPICIHAFTAALAAATAGVNLYRDALADLKFVDGRTELHDGTHVFMAGREAAIERQPAIDHRWDAVTHDLDVGRTYRDRVDAHENLGRPRLWDRLLNDRQLLRPAQDPSLHASRNGILVAARAGIGVRPSHGTAVLCCRCGFRERSRGRQRDT